MIPLDPLTATLGFLCWMAFRRQAGTNFGQMTPEREEVFRNAMEFLRDPARMRSLAEEFQKEGLKFQALLLRKRADWRERPPELRASHDKIFAKAMLSSNIQAILGVAQAFEDMTATVKAKQLREHAKEVHVAARQAQEQEEAAKNAKKNGVAPSPPEVTKKPETQAETATDE